MPWITFHKSTAVVEQAGSNHVDLCEDLNLCERTVIQAETPKFWLWHHCSSTELLRQFFHPTLQPRQECTAPFPNYLTPKRAALLRTFLIRNTFVKPDLFMSGKPAEAARVNHQSLKECFCYLPFLCLIALQDSN